MGIPTINGKPITYHKNNLAADAIYIRNINGSFSAVGGQGILGPYATSAALETAHPAASNTGLFAYLTSGTGYYSNGTAWLPIAIADVNGNLVANVLPRTNTLANLKTLVSGGGELASATDAAAIVQLNGASGSGTATVYSPMEVGHWDEVNKTFCGSTGVWNGATHRFDYSTDAGLILQSYGSVGILFYNSPSLNPTYAPLGGTEMVFGVASATGTHTGNGFTFACGAGGAGGGGQDSGMLSITDQNMVAFPFRAGVNGAGESVLGFFDQVPAPLPVVTGSKASGAALASLLTALASIGLITNSSTT